MILSLYLIKEINIKKAVKNISHNNIGQYLKSFREEGG
jgi:hypothetical protein